MVLDFRVVRCYKFEGESSLKAICDIAISDEFLVKGVKVVDGRDFSIEHRTDEGSSFILNRLACEVLGLQTSTGTELASYADPNGRGPEWNRGPIIGLIDDFHFRLIF